MSEPWESVHALFLTGLQGELERKRRILTLREDVTRYQTLLAETLAALAVEESEAKENGRLVRDMFEVWRVEVRARYDGPLTPEEAAA